MKALEFQARVNPDQTLAIPAAVLDALPIGQTVRVLILVPESDWDRQWEQLERFTHASHTAFKGRRCDHTFSHWSPSGAQVAGTAG